MDWIRPTRTEVDWLVLDLNSFFASCEQQDNPRLRGKPVGIVPMANVDTTCLLAASYEAKKYGLRTGTPVGEAKMRCPDLILLCGSHKKYLEYHHKILAAIDKCTIVNHVLSIDEVACELTGSQRIPENALALAKKIKETIRQDVGECLTSSIGIAPNILLAKLGSDMQKPDGLVMIRPCDLPDMLLPVPLRAFSGIGPGMEKRLNTAGIFSTKDVYLSSAKQMRRIWGGVEGERFHAKLWGHNINRIVSGDSKVFSHEHVLEPSLRNVKDAHDVLRYLLAKGAERLRRTNHYCKRLGVRVRFDQFTGYWGDETDFSETHDTHFLLHILDTLWKNYPGNRPMKVGIALHGLVPATAHQHDLFDTPKPPKLYKAIDSINEKYGRHSLTFGLNKYVQSKMGTAKIAFQHIPDERDV